MGTHDRKSDSPPDWAAWDCGSVGQYGHSIHRDRTQRFVQFQ